MLTLTLHTYLVSYSQSYDGTKTLVYPQILESLGNGVDPDRMKGALYLLGGKAFASFSILDARFFGDFVLKVLSTQDQEKESIQAVINKITEDTIVRTSEPFTLRSSITVPAVDAASAELVPQREQYASQSSILIELRQAVKSRSVFRDAAFDKMIEDLLDLAERWVFPSTSLLIPWLKLTASSCHPVQTDDALEVHRVRDALPAGSRAKRSTGEPANGKVLYGSRRRRSPSASPLRSAVCISSCHSLMSDSREA